ncbi:MAG: type II toxin-antitoxin system HicB family antitoxin [Caldilineales bacterium]|nr:type II toxin-antitoxin system HicB family antitoxin [Caldilineales bacterium]
MKRFLVIIEQGKDNFSAYAPDLPGCVATGATYDDTLATMYEAIEFHLEAMIEDGEEIPSSPFSMTAYLAVPEPALRKAA